MRLWLGTAAAAAIIFVSLPAQARSGGGMAGFAGHGGGRIIAHPAVAKSTAVKSAAMARSLQPFRWHLLWQRNAAFASAAGYGYGNGYDAPFDPFLNGQDVPAAIGPGQATEAPAGLPAPAWLYGYGLPPRPVCFKPRLIMIGKAAPKTHLPKVVYGGPLACGYKG